MSVQVLEITINNHSIRIRRSINAYINIDVSINTGISIGNSISINTNIEYYDSYSQVCLLSHYSCLHEKYYIH